MTIRSRLGAIFWISFLIAAVSIIQKGAVAEEMLGDFVRDGDYIPAAGDPMSPLERLLFVDIQDILENMQKKKPTDVAFMQGATKRSLLNVHIGKTGTILVNLSPKITPRTEFQDDDEFFNQLRMGVQIAGSRRLGRQDWGSVGAYFVFEQKLVNRSRPKSGRLKNLSPSKRSHVSRQFRVPPAGDLVVISTGHGRQRKECLAVPPLQSY